MWTINTFWKFWIEGYGYAFRGYSLLFLFWHNTVWESIAKWTQEKNNGLHAWRRYSPCLILYTLLFIYWKHNYEMFNPLKKMSPFLKLPPDVTILCSGYHNCSLSERKRMGRNCTRMQLESFWNLKQDYSKTKCNQFNFNNTRRIWRWLKVRRGNKDLFLNVPSPQHNISLQCIYKEQRENSPRFVYKFSGVQ